MNNKVICENGICKFIDDNEEEEVNKTTSNFPFPNKEDSWTVYGSSLCGYCRKVKKLLEKKGVNFKYHDINDIKKRTRTIYRRL